MPESDQGLSQAQEDGEGMNRVDVVLNVSIYTEKGPNVTPSQIRTATAEGLAKWLKQTHGHLWRYVTVGEKR